MPKSKSETALEKLKKIDPDFVEVLEHVAKQRLNGIERYGINTYGELGCKGIFVDVNRKFVRLKRHFWEGKDIGSEKITDSMLDSIVYNIFLMIQYRKDGK